MSQVQPYWNNSLAIRQEIQRFESVHPSIYAIYDLIESIPDAILGQQIRDHVVCIEGKDLFLIWLCTFMNPTIHTHQVLNSKSKDILEGNLEAHVIHNSGLLFK